MAKKSKNSKLLVHYTRTMTPKNLSRAANYVGGYVLKGLGALGRIFTAPLTGGPLGPATVVLPKTKKLLDAERKLRETQEELIGKAMTWVSPLNYGAALATGNGLDARKGEEEVASWSPAWLAAARLGELYVGPKAVKGVKSTPRMVVNTAAKAGVKPAKAAVVAREIKLATKNRPNLSNRTISINRENNAVTNSPDVTYTLYNEFGEPIGKTNVGYPLSGNSKSRMVEGVMSKNNGHKVSEDTYNQAVLDILDNGGEGLESGWSLMMPLRTLPVTSKFPHTVIGLQFGNPVRLLTGTTKRPILRVVKGNHYIDSTPQLEWIDWESETPHYKVSITEEPSTSLKFFERKPSKISEAERRGIPKGERAENNPEVMQNARLFAEKYGYNIPENIDQVKNMYRLHNRFFRTVTTEPFDINPDLYPELKGLSHEQKIKLLASKGYPKFYRSWDPKDVGFGFNDDFVFVSPSVALNIKYSYGDLSNTVMLQRPFSFGKPNEWHINADWKINPSTLNIHTKGMISEGNAPIYDEAKISTEHLIPIKIAEKTDKGSLKKKQGGKMNILEFLKNGSGIHIKKKNRGKFTSYCGGKVTDECILKGKNSSNPAIRKRATFAANARKWKHKEGGIIKATKGTAFKQTVSNALGKVGSFLNSDWGKLAASGISSMFGGGNSEPSYNNNYSDIMANTTLLYMLNQQLENLVLSNYDNIMSKLHDPDNFNADKGSIVGDHVRHLAKAPVEAKKKEFNDNYKKFLDEQVKQQKTNYITNALTNTLLTGFDLALNYKPTTKKGSSVS